MPSTSLPVMPACSSAAPDTRAIRLSVSGSASFPKGMCDHPAMTAFVICLVLVMGMNGVMNDCCCLDLGGKCTRQTLFPQVFFQHVGLFFQQAMQLRLSFRRHS